MSGETCQFCGGKMQMLDADLDWCPKCKRSAPGTSSKDASELARFRAMFPTIMPDDPREITPEICDAMGLVNEHDEWWTDSLPCGTSVRISDRGVWVNGEGYGLKAGQLACLTAARRNLKAKGG